MQRQIDVLDLSSETLVTSVQKRPEKAMRDVPRTRAVALLLWVFFLKFLLFDRNIWTCGTRQVLAGNSTRSTACGGKLGSCALEVLLSEL